MQSTSKSYDDLVKENMLLNKQLGEALAKIEDSHDKSVDNFRTFFNKVDEFLFVLDENGNILEVNETALKRLGYTKDELVGKLVLVLHPEEKREEAIRIFDEIVSNEDKSCPLPLISKNNEIIPVETRAIKSKWNNQNVIFGVSKDLSKIKYSEQKFSKVFHVNPGICCIIDVYTDKFVEVNNTFYKKLSFTPEQVSAKKVSELLKLSDKVVRESLNELKENKRISNFDIFLPTASGEKIPVWGFAETVVLDGKKYLYTVAIDVSDKIVADQKLKESERLLKDAQSIARLGYYSYDILADSWECSESLNNIFEIEDSIKKDIELWLQIVHPDYKVEMLEYFQNYVIRDNNEFDKEYKIVGFREKSEKWVYGKGTLKFNEKNEPIEMFGTIQDITEKKESEWKIQKSENALRTIIQNTMGKGGQEFFDALVVSLSQITKADYTLIGVNINSSEVKTVSLYQKQKRLENFIYSIEETPCEKVINKETCIYTDDVANLFPKAYLLKKLKIKAYVGTPIFNHLGESVGTIVSLFRQPITDTFFIKSIFEICSSNVGSELERTETNSRIKENEEILNKIFDHAPVIMMLVDENAQIIKINHTAEQSSAGLDDKFSCKNVFSCIGENVDSIGKGANELCANCVISSTLNETINSGTEIFKKEADIITLKESEIGLRTYLISSTLIEKGTDTKVLLTFDDITEQKKIEEELLLSREKSVYNEKRYRLLSNLTFEGIMLHQNQRIIDVNRALSKMTGYSYSELIGQDSMRYIFPEEYKTAFEEKMSEDYSLPYETEIISKKGHRFPVEIESRYFKQNNQRIRVSAIRDITDRKLGEKKILKAVMQTEENERARFAQELHDGLGPILSNVQMYFQWLADEDENKQFVFEKGSLSLKNAFSTLREISNNLSPHILHNFGLVHAINNFIETIVSKNLRIDFKTNIESKRFGSDLEISMYRIVTELVSNTLKYSGASRIGLEIKARNGRLRTIYTDNGKGFNIDEVQNRGKGFGLINIRNRIKTIHGNISVESEIEKGVRVKIKVPLK